MCAEVARQFDTRPFSERSDEELIDAYLTGERDAFGVLFTRYREAETRFVAHKYHLDEAIAADVVDEALLKAQQGLSTFKRDGVKFKSWLFRIVNNAAIDLMRRRKIRVVAEEAPDDLPSTGSFTSPEQGVMRRELRDALRQLPEAQRAVIEMADIAGMTTQEIAEALGIPRNTVMTRLKRGRDKLQVILAGEMVKEEAA